MRDNGAEGYQKFTMMLADTSDITASRRNSVRIRINILLKNVTFIS